MLCFPFIATPGDSETGKLLAFSGIGVGGQPSASSRGIGIGGGGGGGGGRAASSGGQHQRNQPPGQKMNMCGLLSLQFYQPYFDVDTSQVKARLLQAAVPMRHTEPFLRTGDDAEGGGDGGEPDLYGPVWVRERAPSESQHKKGFDLPTP